MESRDPIERLHKKDVQAVLDYIDPKLVEECGGDAAILAMRLHTDNGLSLGLAQEVSEEVVSYKQTLSGEANGQQSNN